MKHADSVTDGLLLNAGFFWRNISASTFSGERAALNFETMWPAAEKTRSAGTDVAGTHSKDLANFDSTVSEIYHSCWTTTSMVEWRREQLSQQSTLPLPFSS